MVRNQKNQQRPAPVIPATPGTQERFARWLPLTVAVLGALFILAFTVPFQAAFDAPTGAFDYSWMVLLHDAVATGRQFGKQIILPQGPMVATAAAILHAPALWPLGGRVLRGSCLALIAVSCVFLTSILSRYTGSSLLEYTLSASERCAQNLGAAVADVTDPRRLRKKWDANRQRIVVVCENNPGLPPASALGYHEEIERRRLNRTMKILIAPDKFKGCLSAAQVSDAIAIGLRRADPQVQLDMCPMADGGEGTVAALVAATGGKLITRRVTGPLADMKVDAVFGLLGDGQTAVIEMAAASGLALLPRAEDRDPMNTTTFGTGELLVAAAELGAKHCILGIGGSATVDGGIGAAQACGLPVILEGGQPVSPTEPLCGRDLPSVVLIKHGRGSPVERMRITVACDVTNPLYGDNGAAPIYGPQKGATPGQVRELDAALRQLALRTGKVAEAGTPGAGAAGGLGFCMLAYFGATLRSGIETIIDATRLRDRLACADLCITGEGRLDAQSLHGKTPVGVARLCREVGVPCVAIAGSLGPDLQGARAEGLTAWFSICDCPMEMSVAMRQAPQLLERAAENVLALVRAARQPP